MNSNQDSDKMMLLSGLAMLLQSCEKEDEIIEVIYWYLPRLFPNTRGRVFLNDESSGQSVLAFAWPEEENIRKEFPVKDCPALLAGNVVDGFESREKGCAGCLDGGLCTPFRQDKDAFGLFCLDGNDKKKLSSECKGLAFITTEYLSMAISNIRLKRKLRDLTILDPLTSLYNRRYMGGMAAREIKKAKRSKTNLGMIMVDLDYFKRINDRFGHDGGDEVLQKIAALFKAEVRSEDIVCRFGGEEFFILISGGEYTSYFMRAEQLRQKIKALEIVWKGQKIDPLTASFGVAAFPAHGDTFDRVMKIADQALYLSKEQGRDRVSGGQDL